MAGTAVRGPLAERMRARADDPREDSFGLYASIHGREEAAFVDRDALFEQGDRPLESGVDLLLPQTLYAGIGFEIEWLCPWWESGIADTDEQRPAESDVPAPLLSGLTQRRLDALFDLIVVVSHA